MHFLKGNYPICVEFVYMPQRPMCAKNSGNIPHYWEMVNIEKFVTA